MTVPDFTADTGGARIKALDGLRALVLLVLVFHFSVLATRGGPPTIVAPVMLIGVLGVVALDVFFVLSGFLITGILLDTKGSPGYFRNFYLRRAFRILPLYYGFLFVYLLVLPRVVPWDPAAIDLSFAEQLPYWLHFVNIPYGLDGRLAAFTGHYWSLSIEEQFYLVWPVVVFACTRAGIGRVAVVCLVVAPIVRTVGAYAQPDTLLFYSFTFGRLDGLALGALAALAWREPGAFSRFGALIRRVGLAAGGVAVVLMAWLVRDLATGSFAVDWRPPLFLTASAWCAAAVVVGVLQGDGGMFRRLAESRPARRVGTYSYGLYVVHDPLAYLVDQAGWLHRPGADTSVAALAGYVVVMTALSIAVAALSWHALERPILRHRPRQVVPPAHRRS